MPQTESRSFWFVLPLGLTRSNAYRLCWLPCFSLGNSRWKASGPEGLSFLVMKRQVRSFKLAQRRISCLFSPTAPEEGMWSRVWAPCPGAMPNPGGCYPLREGWSGFMPRKHFFSIQLWRSWKCSEKPWNARQGAAELFLCNWMPSQNIMSQFGTGVNPEACTIHQFKPWGRKPTEQQKQLSKVWLVFALATLGIS